MPEGHVRPFRQVGVRTEGWSLTKPELWRREAKKSANGSVLAMSPHIWLAERVKFKSPPIIRLSSANKPESKRCFQKGSMYLYDAYQFSILTGSLVCLNIPAKKIPATVPKEQNSVKVGFQPVRSPPEWPIESKATTFQWGGHWKNKFLGLSHSINVSWRRTISRLIYLSSLLKEESFEGLPNPQILSESMIIRRTLEVADVL